MLLEASSVIASQQAARLGLAGWHMLWHAILFLVSILIVNTSYIFTICIEHMHKNYELQDINK
jgi:hypothetical protein